MNKIKIYEKVGCCFSKKTRELLDNKKLEYESIPTIFGTDEYFELCDKTNWETLPQIFIGEKFIGGCDDLYLLDEKGELDLLVKG